MTLDKILKLKAQIDTLTNQHRTLKGNVLVQSQQGMHQSHPNLTLVKSLSLKSNWVNESRDNGAKNLMS